MKYFGEETKVEVVTKSIRTVEYIRCDKCGKKIFPHNYRSDTNLYVHVHTWHNDWGNDSCDSDDFHDYCKECAEKVVSNYVTGLKCSMQLELKCDYLFESESYDGYKGYVEGYQLVANDKSEVSE